jgi:DNA-directed RNA polymerase subunit RPC12/RpoP
MGLKGTCSNCGMVYHGWALQEERYQHCKKCGTKLTITRIETKNKPSKNIKV